MSRPSHHAADGDHLPAHPAVAQSQASDYHPDWVFAHNMGPNALWLMEWLTEAVRLAPDSRVLDRGCGRRPARRIRLMPTFLGRRSGSHRLSGVPSGYRHIVCRTLLISISRSRVGSRSTNQ